MGKFLEWGIPLTQVTISKLWRRSHIPTTDGLSLGLRRAPHFLDFGTGAAAVAAAAPARTAVTRI
jgi:hypothetical protein